MVYTVREYAEKYRLSRTCVRDMIADGRLATVPDAKPTAISVPPGHTPPLRYSGNPHFANPSYQRELARRPRPGRKR